MRAFLVWVCTLTALISGSPLIRAATDEPPVHSLPPQVQQHVDLAYLTLHGDVTDTQLPTMLFGVLPKENGKGGMPKLPILPAARVFDQLYYLGMDWVSAWALVTSDGIILIDTLPSGADAQKYIEGGLRSLKLDPEKIKYILITHGHDDHFGGAKYLQDKYHARVLMSAVDWDLAAQTAAQHPQAGLPARDMVVADGQTLTLGDTRVRMYVTPGHTPGVVSTLFTVTDHGQPHVVSFFGGMGLQFIDKDPAKGGFATMRDSLLRFAKLSVDSGADVILADHPFNDGSYAKVQALRAGTAAGRNPWIAGQDAVLRYYVATIEALQAVEELDRLCQMAPTAPSCRNYISPPKTN
jgi:metallo-beta-lactamase class B